MPRSRSPKPSASHATIRRFIVEGILRELIRIEPRCRALLARNKLLVGGHGLYANVALHEFVACLESAAAQLERPDLGMDLGWNFQLWEVGPVYHLIASARTLREALATYQRFQGIWQSNTPLTVGPAEDGATRYSYRIDDARIWPRQQDAEFAIASFCAMVRQLLGPRWTPLEIGFEHAVNDRRKSLAARFRCRVGDLADANTFAISNADLDRPLPGHTASNDVARALVEQHLVALLAPAEDAHIRPLAEQVAEVITQRLGQDSLALDAVAAQLNLAPRTMRRKLTAMGTSFGALLTRERQRKAENLLASGIVRVDEVALRLGYASQAAFSRAFRNWTGEPPLHRLRAARQDDPLRRTDAVDD
ncbi:AraC family transcriptional regulator ligand-binding domain-containing protein [Pseudotabrizicola sp. 4114]|uniref:AraC family transcriptional regulator n=1 Tax=Pseudotabrizicola sp. 4114 TaxID=2817731 RepID=UPI00285E32F4|nr:AraC-like DNA-binding protein [Pseudorhodobacter sp. 4114]